MNNIEKTLSYYSKNYSDLIKRYEKSNLSFIQGYLLKILKIDDYILEIGFGAGREIDFLFKNGFKNLYGVDGCKEFVEYVKKKFKTNNFYYSVLPQMNIPLKIKFDFIYSIALWMHLPTEIYEESVKNIVNLLSKNGKVFLSYSLEERDEKERYFQQVDEKLLDYLFNKYGLIKIDEFITHDSLNRNINWKNILYGSN